ncbi:MAG: TrkA family potassium uptake protein [Acidobacteria bacterium]|nr:TrkA family potassium uptake protein [Acidobacteriota bacterium]
MRRSQKRLLMLVLSVPIGLVVCALVYMWGMETLEAKPRGFWDALEFVSETLSTTGYGFDSRWHHPLMVIFVVLLQVFGVFFVFLVIPIYLVPFLEERFEERLPREASPNLRDHVVVYRFGPAVETLVENLSSSGVPALVVETNEDEARRNLEQGRPVVFVRTEEDSLDAARIMLARAIVANGSDEENAAMILRARQMEFRGPIYALVENPVHRKPMEIAGATVVYTPKHILAAALAARASEAISPRLAGIQQLGDHLELRELRITPSSPFVGRTLRDSEIGARSGATVIGQWVGGRLLTQPGPEMRLEPRGILVVVGSRESLAKLATLVEGATPLRRTGHFLVAGFGEVGQKVHQLLTDADEDVRVVDRIDRKGVDIVGDVLDPSVLVAAGVETARSVILALDTDDATLFATVIVQDCATEAPVIARVNHARNVENIYRAGADFALSISKVSGQMLSYRLLGHEAVSLYQNLRVQKLVAGALAGRHPHETALRSRGGCSIVAVQRGAEVATSFPSDFRLREDDSIFACGTNEAVARFRAEIA